MPRERDLVEADISCYLIARYHHDHLFVLWSRAAEAVGLLRHPAIP